MGVWMFPEDWIGTIEVMDKHLFRALRPGFGRFRVGDWEPHEPNVMFTTFDPEPSNGRDIPDYGNKLLLAQDVVGKYWVAVIDYHW